MFGRCLESVWSVPWRCLESVWKVFGLCLDGNWMVSGGSQDGIWMESERCLECVCDSSSWDRSNPNFFWTKIF